MAKQTKKTERKEQKPREAGPVDTAVMVCKICAHAEFEQVYQIVWVADDHPHNQTGKPFFQPSLFKYVCKKCGGEEAVLPPGFEVLRAAVKAARNPMKIVRGNEKENEQENEGAAVEGDAAG